MGNPLGPMPRMRIKAGYAERLIEALRTGKYHMIEVASLPRLYSIGCGAHGGHTVKMTFRIRGLGIVTIDFDELYDDYPWQEED